MQLFIYHFIFHLLLCQLPLKDKGHTAVLVVFILIFVYFLISYNGNFILFININKIQFISVSCVPGLCY